MVQHHKNGSNNTPPSSKPADMSDRFITRAEARDIAAEAAEEGSNKAIKQTFALLGVDLDEFESVQDLRGDLQWVKSGRRMSRVVGTKAGSSVVGLITISVLVAVGDALRKMFFGH